MLSLRSETPVAWVGSVLPVLDEVLVDHAHCEKKAASTALGLLFRYADHEVVLRPLSELAREELRHFESLLDILEARGIRFERQIPSRYAGRLHEAVRRGPHHLLDTLIVCALIEARSCERMKLLAENLEDDELAGFYADLLASEARHFSTYLHLAEHFEPREVVQARLAELAAHEADVLATGPQEPRLHGPFTS
ncbi:MAG: tRNA-(ms[2]io[6]A)-hydroxylase [Myxococcales bacterium]|nr:tRNA-(ms[2]io[6]A)-hydroxylase [Myxococcales bacterium]